MSEPESLFVRSYGAKNVLECAFVWRGLPAAASPPLPPIRFGWTSTARGLFKRVQRLALDTKKPEGRELPYADLRAVLQARVPNLVLLNSRLFSPDEEAPLFAATGTADSIKAAAHLAIRAWVQLTLRPWAEALGTDCGDIDLIEEKGQERQLLALLASPPFPEPERVPDALRADFRQYADILLAMVASRLDGCELFDGLGPVRRVLDREYGNKIEFETWPSSLPGGVDLFSMAAVVSVETRPSSRLPFIVVKAGKRIWCREFPPANRLFRQRRISVHVLTKTPQACAITLSAKLDNGVPKTNLNAIVYEAGRETDQSFSEDLPALVVSRGRAPDLFVGVPFRYGYRPETELSQGVTLQDQVDLFQKVGGLIASDGFHPSRLRELDAKIKRPEEFHAQAGLFNLITHHFGRVEKDDVPARVEELFGSPEKKARGRAKPDNTVDLEALVGSNRARLDKAFGQGAAVDLVFVCRREDEETIFRSAVALIFGDRVHVVRHAMPEGVHGTRRELDGDVRNNRTKRAEERRDAWMPLATQLKTDSPGSPVIVQAAMKYDGKDEDEVNKNVGRNTLATVAGCNVQYLLPPAKGNAAEYMHRVQASLYDLLFGHAGLGPSPAPIVDAAFIDCPRPRIIVGISVVSQASSRTGRPDGASLAVAMKTEVATGRISGRIGFLRNGLLDAGAFETFSKTLVKVAGAGVTSLGEKQPDRRRNFLAFVRRVVDEVAAEDPHALILVESTSARSLWTWLSDEHISSDMYLEDSAAAPPSSWKGLRFVRVREGSAGRLAVQTERRWTPATRSGQPGVGAPIDEVYVTASERLVESLPEGNARARHYLTAHGFNVRNRGARGQSVYRTRPGFQKVGPPTPAGSPLGKRVLLKKGIAEPWDVPSRIPVTLEITVLPSQDADSDAIAALVSGLRNGYAHTADGTFLPAPLSFRTKILDYMDQYGTGVDDDQPDPDPIDEETDQTVEPAGVDLRGYAETRRWYEGSGVSDLDEIPDFDDEAPEDESESGRAPAPPAILNHSHIQPRDLTPKTEIAFKALPMIETPVRRPAEEDPPSDGSVDLEDLVARLRSPSAPLPAFATEDFLTNAIHVVRADTRHMHDDREWIRTVTGFPWPEERPALTDIPKLYSDALTYPAFAIVFQHQFFPDDDNRGGRGLPKHQIIFKNFETWKRVRRTKVFPKGETNNLATRALNCALNGGDKDSHLAEVLGLPGHSAWGAKCSHATHGLSRLESEGEEWADVARYLRAVIGPFSSFGPDRTIGEIMEEVVIPHAIQVKSMPALETPPPAEGSTLSGSETDDETKQPRGLAEIEDAWRRECENIVALAQAAAGEKPQADVVAVIRRSVSILEELDVRAAAFVPAMIPTAELREGLRALTAKAAEALNALIGEALNAPELLSGLFGLPVEAPEEVMAIASGHKTEADAAVAEADAGAQEIERLEATLPKKAARQRALEIDDNRDLALRRALRSVEAAIDAFGIDVRAEVHKSPVTQPQADPASEVASIEPISLPDPVPTEPFEEEILDHHDDVMLESPPQDMPVVPAPEVARPDDKGSEAVDPLKNEIAARLDKLFEKGEFGLAYHLRRCSDSVLPQSIDDTYTADELRLASAGGRAIGLSGQDIQSLMSLRSEALSIAQSLADLGDDRSTARLTLLLAGAIPAALFRSDDGAAVPLAESIAALQPFENFRGLVSTIEENRRFGFPLTPANLLAVEAHSREHTFVTDAVSSIKDTVSDFKSAGFRFQYGERIKHSLTQPHGLLGRLSSGLTESNHDTAREVADQLDSREKIFGLIDAAAGENAAHEMDLQARERIFTALSRVAQQCTDLIRAVEGLQTLRKSAQRLDTVKRLRDLALAGIETALNHEISAEAGPLTTAAIAQAKLILASARDLLKGISPREWSVPPLAVGLHSPLLWLAGMTWAGGWTPSPYSEERLLQEIMGASIPLIGDDVGQSVASAFEARRSESAFVPAQMLLNIAHWYGVGETITNSLQTKLDADREVKKHQIVVRLAEAERMIERMRRMAVGSLDQSARLKETLSTVNPKNLPAELSRSLLPETLTGDRIEDFNSALSRIREVETEAQREFNKATEEYAGQIARLGEDAKHDPQTATELRNLLDRREFTTLADWLNMLRTGGARKHLLPSGPLNSRLAEFKRLLPELKTVDVLQVARAIDEGRSFGSLDYSHLDPDQRQQAATVARTLLPSLKRNIKSASGSQVKDTLQTVVSQLLFEVTKCDPDEVLTKIRQQIYVFDAKLSMPPVNSESLLLPEFGSLTQGSWRICVTTSAVPQQALLDLAEGASPRGVLVIYLGVLNPERRAQLRLDLFKRRRAMLVVDEALIAAALADKQDHRRAVLEIAQGFSGADPYRDYARSAVPAEMFKGRSFEKNAITNSFGSYIVYGGRRLGKTALLQHVHATPPANAVFAYVDVVSVVDASDAFEQISRRIPIFPAAVRTADEFTSTVTAWLDQDERRRLLLLIDEADNLIKNEDETNFRCILALLQLMADSKNRFKFVLAGLHNVSRIARTENSPLVHISNNPLQIGPLLNDDVDDAEFLVRGPLAAMGFEFEKREDVWRILSFTNYYPVLIQVFCEELLTIIHDRAQQTGRLPDTIATLLVEQALQSSDVRGKLFATFEKTIVSIEGRYELLTYILAARELLDHGSGTVADGMTPAEVAERAMEYWPAAFPRGSDPIEFEYLLEEMDGFGIARRTVPGGFALRSRSLLELMAYDEADLTRKLDGYRNKPRPPKIFDPKNNRRVLGKPLPTVESSGHLSPLTDGQEADLLAQFAPAASVKADGSAFTPRAHGVGVVFGTECAGIQFVEAALMDAGRTKNALVEVEPKSYENKKDLLEDARRGSKSGRPRVLVVSSRTRWRSDWIVECERLSRIRRGEVRIVFVGGPDHATAWSSDTTSLKRIIPQIKLVKLRPVTRSYLGSRLDSLQLSGDLVDRIINATGGWSDTVGPLLARISERPAQATALTDAAAQTLRADSGIHSRLGIPDDLVGFFRELAQYADGSIITFRDFQHLCTSDGRTIVPSVLAIYCDLLGIISFSPDQSENRSLRKVDLNQLVHGALLPRE
jgi:hypothetical protein